MACAGATGPGVIDRVAIDPQSGEFHIRTIENRGPVAICGSGLVDLVAQLFTASS